METEYSLQLYLLGYTDGWCSTNKRENSFTLQEIRKLLNCKDKKLTKGAQEGREKKLNLFFSVIKMLALIIRSGKTKCKEQINLEIFIRLRNRLNILLNLILFNVF